MLTKKKIESYLGVIWYVIFLQALVATLGSLYYSSFGDPVVNLGNGVPFPLNGGFAPCTLCWFGRILMYPITVLTIVAGAKNDKQFTDYILPFSITGIALSTYHYLLQKTNWATPFNCTANFPCNAMEVNYFGFITIPMLALVAYIVITTLCLAYKYLVKKEVSIKE